MVAFIPTGDLPMEAARRLRARRLANAWTQRELAARSGVTLATLRKFERTGAIAFPSFLRLAESLTLSGPLLAALEPQPVPYVSIDDVAPPRPATRQRGK